MAKPGKHSIWTECWANWDQWSNSKDIIHVKTYNNHKYSNLLPSSVLHRYTGLWWRWVEVIGFSRLANTNIGTNRGWVCTHYNDSNLYRLLRTPYDNFSSKYIIFANVTKTKIKYLTRVIRINPRSSLIFRFSPFLKRRKANLFTDHRLNFYTRRNRKMRER